MSWKAEVIADHSGKWVSNAMRFATEEEASAYAYDLSLRWMAVRNTRVVTCDDPVTYRLIEGRIELVKPEGGQADAANNPEL